MTFTSKVYNGNIMYSQINFGPWIKPEGTWEQHAKKVVSDIPGLVDFAIGLMNFVLNLPNGLVNFFGGIQIIEELQNQFCPFKCFWG